jgi:hypothetical protein
MWRCSLKTDQVNFVNRLKRVRDLKCDAICLSCRKRREQMRNPHLKSPVVKSVVWGEIEVEGLGKARDIKLYPGGGRNWDWSETGTHHVPGIQMADVEELVKAGCEAVVLSRGMHLVLQTMPEVLTYLKGLGIEVFVEETRLAVERYNQLVTQGKKVGGLFHSTC